MTESLLRRCDGCGRYSLRASCPACRGHTSTPHPPRYSPEDRYARYRRALYATAAARTEGPSPPSGAGT